MDGPMKTPYILLGIHVLAFVLMMLGHVAPSVFMNAVVAVGLTVEFPGFWIAGQIFHSAIPAFAFTFFFNATILAAVERHRFEWVDQETAYDTAPGGRESSFARDGTHANAETHRRLATLVLGQFQELRDATGRVDDGAPGAAGR